MCAELHIVTAAQGCRELVLFAAGDTQLLDLELCRQRRDHVSGQPLRRQRIERGDKRYAERRRGAQPRAGRRIGVGKHMQPARQIGCAQRGFDQIQGAVVAQLAGCRRFDHARVVARLDPHTGLVAQLHACIGVVAQRHIHNRASFTLGERRHIGPPAGKIDPYRRAAAHDHAVLLCGRPTVAPI